MKDIQKPTETKTEKWNEGNKITRIKCLIGTLERHNSNSIWLFGKMGCIPLLNMLLFGVSSFCISVGCYTSYTRT